MGSLWCGGGRRWSTTAAVTATLLVLLLLVAASPANAIKWLALSRMASVAVTAPDSSKKCENFRPSLVRQQVRFCKDNPAFMDSVKRGAIWAIDECQFQFRTRRWNCSTLNDDAINAFKKAFKPKNSPEPVMISNKTERAVPITIRPDLLDNRGGGGAGGMLGPGGVVGGMSSPSNPLPVPSQYQNTSPVRTQHLPQPPHPQYPRPRRGRKSRKKRKRNKTEGGGGGGGGGIVGPYPIVPQGTREAAFVHAISSAGVAHAITRRCSSGELDDCGCDRSVRGVTQHGFQWSGCSDNIAYGVSLSKRFVDARDRKLVTRKKKAGLRVSSRALMNLHNNEAGRKLIEDNMRVECKCHGVSGSCELKTCWKAMPTFREIGEILKVKFDEATQVQVKEVSGRAELEPNQQYFRKPSEVDLVYVTSSPEYCEYDINRGSLGTQGRRCNKTSRGMDGCDLLCCSRGYTSAQERVKERCSCKFHWCCYVKCRTCIRDITVHTCK